MCAPCYVHFIRLSSIILIVFVQIMKVLVVQFSLASCNSSLWSIYSPHYPAIIGFQTISVYIKRVCIFRLLVWSTGVRFLAGDGIFFSPPYRVQTGSGTHSPPSQWVAEALSPGIKRPGRDADHSPPPSAEVKNTWRYTSTPLLLDGVVLS
jgi:hypothetical protein